MSKQFFVALLLFALGPVSLSFGFTPKSPLVESFQKGLATKAKKADPGFTGFSADRGKAFYSLKHGDHKKKPETRSCETCHTSDPMNSSKHIITGKKIKPLSPLVYRKRFTKVKKIKKWFRRNCKWTLKRSCTAQEQGDFIEYIYSL